MSIKHYTKNMKKKVQKKFKKTSKNDQKPITEFSEIYYKQPSLEILAILVKKHIFLKKSEKKSNF